MIIVVIDTLCSIDIIVCLISDITWISLMRTTQHCDNNSIIIPIYHIYII